MKRSCRILTLTSSFFSLPVTFFFFFLLPFLPLSRGLSDQIKSDRSDKIRSPHKNQIVLSPTSCSCLENLASLVSTMAVLPSHHLAPLLVRQAAANTTTTTLPLPLPQQSLDLSTYPTTPLQQFGLFLIIFFPALSVVFVSLRIYDRFKTKTFGADDYFIIAAGILAALSAVISWYMMRMQYIGIHLWQIPPPGTFNPRNGMIVNYIVVVLYNPQLALVKSSVLFFLLRLGGHQRGLRKGIQVLNWSNIALMVAVLFASIFTCVPVYKYWDKSVEGGVCNNEAMQYLVTSGLTILTDVLVLIIPIKIVWGLQVAKKLKIILICLLCSGIV